MHYLANPARFVRVTSRITPFLAFFTPLVFALGLYLSFWASPPDYQQGESVRIMYIHVPSAWMALSVYCLVGLASAALLIWRHPLAGIAAEAASPLGMMFTLLALISGSLWGKPMWGTFWVWDARLTSFLLLFFLYAGHWVLLHAFEDRERAGRAASALAIVGLINVPIIKFSVDWWNTLHQPASLLRWQGPAIDPAFLWPLGIMALAFHLYFFLLFFWRIKIRLLSAKENRVALS